MFKERLEIAKAYMLTHKNEMIILGVMFGLSLAITVAFAGGDIGESIAKRGR